MNHAVTYETPTVLWSSLHDMPTLAIIQTAGSHLSKPSGESWKIVPVFRENFRLGCRLLHSQPFRDEST